MSTYYIDSGSATNGVGSFSDPKNTIPTLAAGDIVLFKGGTKYTRTSAWAPNVPNLTIGSYNGTTGERIFSYTGAGILDCRGFASAGSGLSFGSAANSNIEVNGLIIYAGNIVYHNDATYICKAPHSNKEPGVAVDWATYWVDITIDSPLPDSATWSAATNYVACFSALNQQNNCSGVTFKNVRTIGGSSGIRCGSSGIGSSNNIIIDSCFVSGTQSASEAGIIVTGKSTDQLAQNATISNCKVYGCANRGLDIVYCTDAHAVSIDTQRNTSSCVRINSATGTSLSNITANYSSGGSGVVVDTGSVNTSISTVIANYNYDNGISISAGATNTTIENFTTCFNGNPNDETMPSSSLGDGISDHGGSATTFKNGISAFNTNSGAAHVGGSSGTMENVKFLFNGYTAEFTPVGSNFNRGGIALIASGAWSMNSCVVCDNYPREVKLDSSTTASFVGANNIYYHPVRPDLGFSIDAGSNEISSSAFFSAVSDSGSRFTFTKYDATSLNPIPTGATARKEWFIDSSASVCGDGSQSSPLKSIYDLNQSVIRPGDTIFVSGEHRIIYDGWAFIASGVGGALVTINMTGATFKPSKSFNSTTDWVETTSGRWRTYAGKIGFTPGFALFGAEAQRNVGTKKAAAEDCVALRDWYYDTTNRYVEVYAGASDPATTFEAVETPTYRYGIELDSVCYLKFIGGSIKHSSSSFFKMHNCHHIDVYGQTYSWGGGGGGGVDGGDAAGDGAQISRYSHDITFNDCLAYQIFDVGFTAQLYSTTLQETLYNIYFNNCTAIRCGELGAAACHVNIASECHDIYFRNCVGRELGYGWSGYANNSVHGVGIGIKTSVPLSNTHDIYVEDCLIDGFASIGINNTEGNNVYIRRNQFYGGTGDYTTTTPAAVKFHGGSGGETDNECTGVIEDNIIAGNNCYGILTINNTPASGNVTIQNNTLIDNATAEIYSWNSDKEIITGNIICATTALCIKDDTTGTQLTSCDTNHYYKTDAGDWFQRSSTTYATLALWAAATGYDASSTNTDVRPLSYIKGSLALAYAITSTKTVWCDGEDVRITLG